MKKAIILKITILTLFIYSCNYFNKDSKDTILKIDSTTIISDKTLSINNEEIIQEEFQNEFDILLPTTYRDWENKNEVDNLNSDWLDLNIKDGKYYLSKANYLIENGYDECAGVSTKTIQSNNQTILYLNNSEFEIGELNSLEITKNKIWPKEKISFNFNSDVYTLRAEGNVKSSEKIQTENGIEIYQEVENYKLYLSLNNSTETLFLVQKSFNDTFVELLFIGDIDRDGKLDFIFGANRDYEEERVLLFLSSDPKNGKQIRKVSEIAVQFDC